MENCNRIVADLERKIHVINSEAKTIFEEINLGILHSQESLRKLRTKTLSEGFLTPEDECLFFKTIKPIPSGYLIYYLALAKFEVKKPKNTQKKVKRYIESQITKHQKYFAEHQYFYQYLERKRTDKDTKYFLRSMCHAHFHPDSFSFFMDEDFSTTHDYIVAKFFAHQLLIDRLNNELKALDMPPQVSEPLTYLPSNLKWTGKNIDLVELGYALHEVGVINYGNINIKDLILALAKILNIEVGEIYRILYQIQSRKINPTKFLDLMRNALLRRMDQNNS